MCETRASGRHAYEGKGRPWTSSAREEIASCEVFEGIESLSEYVYFKDETGPPVYKTGEEASMTGARGIDGGRSVGQPFQDPAEAIRAEADHGDAGGEGTSGNDRIPFSRGHCGAATGTSSSNDEAHFTDGDTSAEVMSLEELDARVQGVRFEKNSTGSGRHGEEDRRRGGEHNPTQAATRDERQPQHESVSEGVEEVAISTAEEA
ncbi:UNVERIFIED_CONTAM: hypothetical protein PYX00_002599 [Menopon gallinae]|uniref:Uncharacterized protein n=1 Tax=Menopon gallinae TaxID=328185 RepID=A0AAW2IHL8_9NEOP